MVFTGDWNGGERRFDVRVGQHFDLERLARIDSVDGRAVPLREGDLAEVDNYGWGENRTLRWRSHRSSAHGSTCSPMSHAVGRGP